MTEAWRTDYRSWGRTISPAQRVSRPLTVDDAARCLAMAGDLPVLAYGNGRSYGDVPLNQGGRLIDCRGLDRFIAFDRSTGVVTCEAGVLLADILAVACRPEADGAGWLLPVSPGTRFVTFGGAIANDVHGKNHHRFGTFGSHVLAFDLARSDGTRLTCSADEHPKLFAATIGGLGLTGLILRGKLQLRRVAGLAVEAEDIRFDRLADYFALTDESDAAWEYTAAWLDCSATGNSVGRGIFSRARHIPGRGVEPPARRPRLNFAVVPPASLVTPLTVKAFNAAYWRKLGLRGKARRVGSYEKAFYPLDALGNWNRVYGPRGFYQFQCLVPPDGMQATLTELLGIVAASGEGSMLSTLKLFGAKISPGLLSFPAPGATLALDFANRGETTSALLGQLEEVVVRAGGRLYPAKDALMKASTFRTGYPALERFLPHVDPGFGSAFARRVALLPEAGLQRRSMSESPAGAHPATVQTVAIFGATSDIAVAVARRYAEQRQRLILVGRDVAALADLEADFLVRGAPATRVLHGDFSSLDGLADLAGAVWDLFGGLDVLLIAYGSPAGQEEAEQSAAATAAVITVNFTSAAVLLNELARKFQLQGHGTIAAITSVAGDRGRKSNYVYGAAKGGLQRLLEGLRHRLAGSGVAVVDIRPGFVITRMTAHLERKGPLWATQDRVADDIVRAIAARRAVRYTPGFWALIMLLVRNTPRFIFHRTSL